MTEPHPHDPQQPGWTQPIGPPHQPPGQAGPPMPYGYHPPMQVAPKSPGVSLLASFFIPGLGSMLNGDGFKGSAILVAYLCCSVIGLLFWWLLLPLLFLVAAAGLWVWGMVDAYQGARLWNLRHGIIS